MQIHITVIRRGYISENRAADPRPSTNHVTPPPPGESYESENWPWVYWSLQMEFFDTK